MAQFTAQGRLKTLFNGADGISFMFETTKEPFQYKLGCGGGGGSLRFSDAYRIQLHERKHRFRGATGVYSSSSSSENNSNHSNTEAPLNVGEDGGVYHYDEHDNFFHFENDDLACFRGLVLDVSYRPINVVCWKRAICLEFMEKADVLEYYDQTVNSPSGSFYIPAVLRVPHLLQFVKRRRIKNTLSRRNIFQRDNFTCQYCSSRENLTIDHVLPIARGGEWKWENLVAACAKCNSKKGQKTLEEASMKLHKAPKAPKDYDILAIPLTSTAIKMLKMRKGIPEEWHQYLSKPSPEP